VILLDTHVWVRWLVPGAPLPRGITQQIESDERVGVSAISCWEVAMLVQRGRIWLSLPVSDWLQEASAASDIEVVPTNCEVTPLAADLPQHHRDPADRIIIATAFHLNATLVSLDERFPAYFSSPTSRGRLVSG
jgi:PIN domain nuclease of toxin-antitoxin system